MTKPSQQDLDGIHQAIFDLANKHKIKASRVLSVFLDEGLVDRENDLNSFLKALLPQ